MEVENAESQKEEIESKSSVQETSEVSTQHEESKPVPTVVEQVMEIAKETNEDKMETDEQQKENKKEKEKEQFEKLEKENNNELLECKNLLEEFINKSSAEIFCEPVNLNDYPEYKTIIKKPMALFTIRKKFNSNKYNNAYEFADDMRLVWRNAKEFNMPGSGIYVVADNLGKTFERKFARIVKGFMESPAPKKRGKKDDKDISKFNHLLLRNKKESNPDERKEFTSLLKQCSESDIGSIIELIEKKAPLAIVNDENDNELEIQVYHIPQDILVQLNEIMKKKINK